jgi:large subunit ribosomal protein L9
LGFIPNFEKGQIMKIILTEKVNNLGNIGDTVEVKTGYARNYLLPNGKALRWSAANVAVFESKKAELHAKQDAAKKSAESYVDAVKNAKLHMIRQAGDTGQLYGSVSSRDIARMLVDIANVKIDSAQVMLGSPIKSVGSFDTKIALHPDVIVPVKVYVAQTQDEIDALVAGKVLTFGTKKVEEDIEETIITEEVAEEAEEKSEKE